MMPVYLDYNATTPVAPEVLDAMMPYFRESYANASSNHALGREAREAIERARAQVAQCAGARPEEVVFMSSGTECNNAIIKGVAKMSMKRTIAVGATEHPCVLCSARSLQGEFALEFLTVDESGMLEMSDLADVLQRDCALVSVAIANNETGVIQNIAEIARQVRASGAIMHTDGVQATGKIPLSFAQWELDAMTLSAHKCGGPKGIAALVVKREVEWAPLLEGGGHEDGMRSGTENVPGIVGFGKACEIAQNTLDARMAQIGQWRDAMEATLTAHGAVVFAQNARRLPNTCYFGFDGIGGDAMVTMLDQNGFAVTSGAACSSMKDEPSHVLMAMGIDASLAHAAVRVSLGANTRQEEVERFVAVTLEIVGRFRQMDSVVMPA